ncbi:MAG: transposase [Bacteroidales bacterium]|nr:transposase [Bacteroidales bacterium]
MVNEKFRNRFRIPSARATWHNYNAGTYFVTICTQNREHCFGEIVTDGNGEPKMVLSGIGGYAQQQIKNAKIHYPYAEIPLWVVMPNHIHAIVIIRNYDTDDVHDDRRDVARNVSTENGKNEYMSSKSPKRNTLPVVIRGIKQSVTRFANDHAIPFAWQTRFHDHIVRNTDELNRIATYIQNNVAQWESDKYHDSL